jgi:gas vesicle protein
MFTTDDVLSKLGLQTRASTTDYLFPVIGIFGAGILVGAGVALMFAPKSGAMLREDLGRKAMDLKEKAVDLKDTVGRRAMDIKDTVAQRVQRVMPGNGGMQEALEDLEAMSRQELYERASEMNIERRSEMTKPQLIDAIRSA